MIEENLRTWEEFEERQRALEERHEQATAHAGAPAAELLYRGQPNAALKLRTTLERRAGAEVSFLDYYKLAMAAKSRIETFTNKSWPHLPDVAAYAAWLREQEGALPPFYEDTFDYLAYIRHYGFPSPMLDWTASPYVAAFFAFDKAERNVETVSIYVLWEYRASDKRMEEGSAAIRVIGRNAPVHPRHYLQQSQYSICARRRGNEYVYTPHEEVAGRNGENQGALWKLNLPAAERDKVLRRLHKMNVNAFSLFGSEDSLIDMIATTELLCSRRRS